MLPLASQCNNGARSWCSCASDTSCKYLGDKLQCDCGEERKIYEWVWKTDVSAENVLLSENKRDVIFHPVYSSGTAAVRGHQILEQNVHYYWEVKMLTNLYGTDIMIGIGTSKVMLSDWKFRFCSMLGEDKESWGYSYRGIIQHDNTSYRYGPQYNVGSLIGVHVDMCAGTLEYYLNRKPLGIAFRKLKNKEIFPMVCSTAAQSAMRITCAISEAPTLQMACLKVINNNAQLLQQYWDTPGVARIIGEKYSWMTPRPTEEASALELEDEVVLPTRCFTLNANNPEYMCRRLMILQEFEANAGRLYE